MPFALVFIGLIMIVAGARDTHAALGKELISDFTGPGNFLYWIAAIGALGALGSIPQFRTFSRWFMALIIIAMVLRNGGFFDRLSEALTGTVVTPVKGNANYAPGNMQSGQTMATKNDANGFSIPETVGTAESRKNAQTVFNIAKWFF